MAGGGGVIRGGTMRFGLSWGIGGCAVSAVFAGGSVGRGGMFGRRGGGVNVGAGVIVGCDSAAGVVVAAGVIGGTLRCTAGGVSTGRDGIVGDGRVLTGGVIAAAGVGVETAALGEATTVGAGVVATAGVVAAGEAAIDGLGLVLGVPEGRTRGDAEAAGVALAVVVAAVAVAAGVGLAAVAGVVVVAGVGLILATVAVGLGAAAVGLGALVVAGVAEAVVVDVWVGGTNFFGGALEGGVASVLIFVRARSAAERSETDVQPLSTFTSVTRSFTRRGRKTFWTSLRTGMETCSSFPLMRAVASVFLSRRRRYRSIGRGPRERNSS